MIDSLTPLTSLGLSNTDLSVYAFLLKTGESGAPKIKNGLNLHPQLVYRSLDHLQEKGLISVFSRGSWKRYKAAPKSEVEEMVADLKRSLDRSLEVMNRLSKSEVNPDLVRVFFGQDSFVQQTLEMRKSMTENSSLDIFHSKKEFYEIMAGKWSQAVKIHQQKKLAYRLLSFPSLKNLEAANLGDEAAKDQVRFLEESFNSPVSIALGGKRALMTIWGAEMITIVIDSEIFASDFQTYFEKLWSKAKPWDTA